MNAKIVGFADAGVQELTDTVVQDLKSAVKFGDAHKAKTDYDIIENTQVKALRVNKKENIVLKYINLIIKRIIDIIGAIVGIILLIPMTIGIYIANKLTKDDGPLFYSQERIGKDGKIFKIYKYRSMVVGADEKLEKYLEENEEAREEYRVYKKLDNDPRITRIGNFIRKTSIDEFPQFINVIKGEMSLVGPRPYLPREKEEMGEYYNNIVKCKPGLTGFWQVNGRSDVTFDDRLDMDMKYYRTANVMMDIGLVVKTAEKVIKKEGAA